MYGDAAVGATNIAAVTLANELGLGAKFTGKTHMYMSLLLSSSLFLSSPTSKHAACAIKLFHS